MKKQEVRLSIPQHSFVLLDTNVLVDTSKYPLEFSVLYTELERLLIGAMIESTVRFEFLRGMRNTKDGEKLLEELCGKGYTVLVPDSNIFTLALAVARIYMKSDNKSTSVPDTLIAAQMCKYARTKQEKSQLFLATQNHRDFPPTLFERVDDTLITLTDGSIKIVGFYRFRKDRFEKLS